MKSMKQIKKPHRADRAELGNRGLGQAPLSIETIPLRKRLVKDLPGVFSSAVLPHLPAPRTASPDLGEHTPGTSEASAFTPRARKRQFHTIGDPCCDRSWQEASR
jgi:hypothetical protein